MYTVLKVEMASYKKKNNQEIDKMITVHIQLCRMKKKMIWFDKYIL